MPSSAKDNRVRSRRCTALLLLVFGVAATQLGSAPAPPGEHVYQGTEPGVIPPNPIKRVKAQYDDAVRPKKIEGRVRVRMTISSTGKAEKIEIYEPLNPKLDAKAVEAAKQWQWQPATLYGKPVACGVLLEFLFKP